MPDVRILVSMCFNENSLSRVYISIYNLSSCANLLCNHIHIHACRLLLCSAYCLPAILSVYQTFSVVYNFSQHFEVVCSLLLVVDCVHLNLFIVILLLIGDTDS